MSSIDLRASMCSGSRSSSDVPPSSEEKICGLRWTWRMSSYRVMAQKPGPSGSGFQCTGSSWRSALKASCGTAPRNASWSERSMWCAVFVIGLEVMDVLGDLPVGDPAAVALELEPLDRDERVDDLRSEPFAEDLVVLERVDGVVEALG